MAMKRLKASIFKYSFHNIEAKLGTSRRGGIIDEGKNRVASFDGAKLPPTSPPALRAKDL